ncbi:hypothetical protein MKZ38_005710 [Zalerion maritima]|uniref:Uncharacterized protein n=1 Tax=Zalerion maritima TaxID=339359 RepID=A0AAD5RKQ0_9PEZI|nr:hypothetical protein MKZ38_005710 [Zalerion maritima]
MVDSSKVSRGFEIPRPGQQKLWSPFTSASSFLTLPRTHSFFAPIRTLYNCLLPSAQGPDAARATQEQLVVGYVRSALNRSRPPRVQEVAKPAAKIQPLPSCPIYRALAHATVTATSAASIPSRATAGSFATDMETAAMRHPSGEMLTRGTFAPAGSQKEVSL